MLMGGTDALGGCGRAVVMGEREKAVEANVASH